VSPTRSFQFFCYSFDSQGTALVSLGANLIMLKVGVCNNTHELLQILQLVIFFRLLIPTLNWGTFGNNVQPHDYYTIIYVTVGPKC
jgi:hypothetical protein